MASLTKIISPSQTIQMPSRQQVLNNSSLLANILSYISPLDLRQPLGALSGNYSVFGTCKAFRSAAEKTRDCFLRTAHEQGARLETSISSSRGFSLHVLGKPITNQQMLLTMEKITHLGFRQEDFQRGSESIEALLQTRSFPQLRSLTINMPNSGPTIGAVTMKAITAQCHNLQEFYLHFCRPVSQESFLQLLGLKHLKKISLEQSRKIDDNALSALAMLPSLTELSLRDCEAVTHVGISILLKNLSKIQILDVGGNCGGGWYEWGKQQHIAHAIAIDGKTLTHLNMRGGYYHDAYIVQEGNILEIATKCPNLKLLDIRGNHPGTLRQPDTLCWQIKKANPNLQVLI